ncbi:MAG: penicillin-binding protein 1C [Deltaproteobacteria bacterium]|nr:penicillin-binding protein 1C [Deltaproteobacteria bacterium]
MKFLDTKIKSTGALSLFVLLVTCAAVFLVLGSTPPISPADYRDLLSTNIYSSEGVLLRQIPSKAGTFQRWADLKNMGDKITLATLHAEDKRFYTHAGIDLKSTVRAALQNIRHGRIISGASTITQQIIRIAKKRDRNLKDKIKTVAEAVWLDLSMSKAEQLELYLNLISYGGSNVGIYEAGLDYFNLTPDKLSLAQSAFLAVIPRSPQRLNPRKNFEVIQKLKQGLLAGLLHDGRITTEAYQHAMEEIITIKPQTKRNFLAPHFTEQVRRLHTATGAINMTTSLKMDLQSKVEKIVQRHLAESAGHNIQNAAVVVIENHSGRILAWVGSPSFFKSENQGQVDGVVAYRQPGSALKPFTYALGLNQGLTPASILPDIRTNYSLTDGERYSPRNYNRVYHGPVRLREALAGSLNVPAVHMAKIVGPQKILTLLNSMGFHLKDPPWHYGLGITLGNAEVRLLDLANAYAMLARGGVWQPVRLTLDHDSLLFPSNENHKSQEILSPEVAALISDILADEKTRNHFFGLKHPFHFDVPVAVKTGTSSNFKDNWAMGYTQDITVGVWAGNVSGDPMQGTTGATGAGPMLRDVINHAITLYPERSALFDGQRLKQIVICPLSGKMAGPHCRHKITEYFLPGTEITESCEYHHKIKIDKRNGLLADACPKRFVREETGVVYPELFKGWAMEYGRGIHDYSPLCGPIKEDAAIKIVFPDEGSRFLIDPSKQAAFQSIPLKISFKGTLDQIDWFVDDQFYQSAKSPYTVRYPLKPGKHTFMAKSGAASSQVVNIVVR